MRTLLLTALSSCVLAVAPAYAKHIHGLSHSITGFVGDAHVHHHPGYFPTTRKWGFRYIKGGRCHHYHYFKPLHRDC